MGVPVEIEFNPDFNAVTEADKAAVAVAKKQGRLSMEHTVAIDNIRMSNGLYRLVPGPAEQPKSGPRALDDLSAEELKVMMVQLGIKIEKKMTRAEVVGLIRDKLAETEIE